MNLLIVSTSLNPQSRSAIMARHAYNYLQSSGEDGEFLDLTQLELPPCDGKTCYGHPNTIKVATMVAEADCILLATPIYNFDVNSTAKNFLELTGQGWTDKVVGFICAAGGQGSYMSVMTFANSLMLDYRSVIVPRFVYATGSSFEDDRLVDTKVGERIEELVEIILRFAKSLSSTS